MVPAQEDGGLVLAPEVAHVIQEPERGVVAGVIHIVFHIIAEEEIEIRILCTGSIVNRIEAESCNAVEVGSKEDFVVLLFRVQRPEGMDLPGSELGNMFVIRTLELIERVDQPVFIFRARFQPGDVDGMEILAVINDPALDGPQGFEFLRALLPIFHSARTGTACDPVDGDGVCRRIQEPRTVQRRGDVILLFHIFARDDHGDIFPMVIAVVGSCAVICFRRGESAEKGKRTNGHQKFLHHHSLPSHFFFAFSGAGVITVTGTRSLTLPSGVISQASNSPPPTRSQAWLLMISLSGVTSIVIPSV